MDNSDIWKIGITVILTTVGTLLVNKVNHGHALAKENKLKEEDRNRHAVYLAVRIVCVLDPFILECCDVIGDEGICDPRDGCRQTNASEPKLEFPTDVDWRSVKPDLMYRILTLPNEIEHARQVISFVGSEVASPPDYEEYYEERKYQYGKLGIIAFELAADIRSTYGLPKPDYSRWSPRPTLEGAFVKEDEKRKRLAAMGHVG